MIADIEILKRIPDLGQCILHQGDICTVCTDKMCQNERYFCLECQECKPDHEKSHKIISVEQYFEEIKKKLIGVQLPAKNVRDTIKKQIQGIIDGFKQMEIQIHNAITVLQLINNNQWLIVYSFLELTPQKMNSYLCQNDFCSNYSQIERMINNLTNTNYQKFADDLPTYTDELQKKIKTLSTQIQRLVQQSTQITSSFQLPNQQSNDPGKYFTLSFADKDYFASQICKQLKKHNTQKLRSLNLQKNSINSQGLKQIINNEQIKLPNLQVLNLTCNTLDEECLDVFLSSNLPKLKRLILQENLILIDQKDIINFQNKWPKLQLEYENI